MTSLIPVAPCIESKDPGQVIVRCISSWNFVSLQRLLWTVSVNDDYDIAQWQMIEEVECENGRRFWTRGKTSFSANPTFYSAQCGHCGFRLQFTHDVYHQARCVSLVFYPNTSKRLYRENPTCCSGRSNPGIICQSCHAWSCEVLRTINTFADACNDHVRKTMLPSDLLIKDLRNIVLSFLDDVPCIQFKVPMNWFHPESWADIVLVDGKGRPIDVS